MYIYGHAIVIWNLYSSSTSSSHISTYQSSQLLAMNTQRKTESQLVSTVEANTSISFPSFESYDYESLFPDLVNNIKYPPYELVLQQPHSSHYNTQVQLMQSGFNQGIKYPTISEQMIRSNYGPFGREESLQTKSTGLEPPRNNATMGDNSNLSWEMPSRAQHGASHPSSWLGTTMVQSAVQSGGAAAGKQRIRWTHELHEQFVEAVNCLGGAMKATPKRILRLMKSQGLTVFHIKSHLQKYRNAKCVPNFLEGRSGRKTTDGMPISDFKGNGGLHISETLRLQKDVQRTLHEHLEFQRKLQLRIEEHSKHLHSMFDQQKRSCSFVEHHNSNKAIDPSVAGCSSAGVFEEPGKIYLTKKSPKHLY